jgi:hypothetical protein
MNPIQHLLNSTIVPPEVLRAARAISTMKKWEIVVGKDMASRSWPERYDHGTLWVAVVGSAWAQELRMQQEQILTRLNETANEETLFVSIRFGVRPLKKAVVGGITPDEVSDCEGMTIREIAERRLERLQKNDDNVSEGL